MYGFSFSFQGANGNPGKPGPSGDPVRLLKAISILTAAKMFTSIRMYGNM